MRAVNALIHKEAYRAGQLAAWFAVAAVAVVLVETVIALITGTLTEFGMFCAQVAAAAVAVAFGGGAFYDDIDSKAAITAATLPYSRRLMWSLKTATWFVEALVLSALMLALRSLLPDIVSATGGVEVETALSVSLGNGPYMAATSISGWVGLFFGGVWIGQFVRMTVPWTCSPAVMLLLAPYTMLIAFGLLSFASALSGAGRTLDALHPIWLVEAAIFGVASALAAYTAYVWSPPLEARARSKHAAVVFWAAIGGLSLGAIALAGLR